MSAELGVALWALPRGPVGPAGALPGRPGRPPRPARSVGSIFGHLARRPVYPRVCPPTPRTLTSATPPICPPVSPGALHLRTHRPPQPVMHHPPHTCPTSATSNTHNQPPSRLLTYPLALPPPTCTPNYLPDASNHLHRPAQAPINPCICPLIPAPTPQPTNLPTHPLSSPTRPPIISRTSARNQSDARHATVNMNTHIHIDFYHNFIT